MPPKQNIIAFDTSTAHCAVALLSDGAVLKETVEQMSKGQNERLLPICEEVLLSQDMKWADLDAIGVCTGPGNFTGLRIAISTARGLSLSLGIPAIGVNKFELLAFGRDDDARLKLPARPGYIYTQDMQAGKLIGSADMIESAESIQYVSEADLASVTAKIVSEKIKSSTERPKPFYIRPADALPSRDLPIQILA